MKKKTNQNQCLCYVIQWSSCFDKWFSRNYDFMDRTAEGLSIHELIKDGDRNGPIGRND